MPGDPPPRQDDASSGAPVPPEPRSFRPPPWLRNPHLQTLGARMLRPRRAVTFRRERWETPDGDFLDLDFVAADEVRAQADAEEVPRVVVLHGLEGCSESGYVQQTCRELALRGLAPVALNFRSRGGEPNRRRRFYHSGETGDLAHVLERLRERHPRAPTGAVGFSLGGNVLVKLLGERGEEARRLLGAAVAVSVPYDLAAGARALERGLGPMYTAYFLRSLSRSIREKERARGHDYGLGDFAGFGSLRAFDDAFTAPVHGFRDAEDYYRRSSAGPYLPSVRLPTLVIQARDDPFLPEGALPERAIRANPWLVPAITGSGGHVGFLERASPWRPRFWAEEAAARFLDRGLRGGRSRTRDHSTAHGERA